MSEDEILWIKKRKKTDTVGYTSEAEKPTRGSLNRFAGGQIDEKEFINKAREGMTKVLIRRGAEVNEAVKTADMIANEFSKDPELLEKAKNPKTRDDAIITAKERIFENELAARASERIAAKKKALWGSIQPLQGSAKKHPLNKKKKRKTRRR